MGFLRRCVSPSATAVSPSYGSIASMATRCPSRSMYVSARSENMFLAPHDFVGKYYSRAVAVPEYRASPRGRRLLRQPILPHRRTCAQHFGHGQPSPPLQDALGLARGLIPRRPRCAAPRAQPRDHLRGLGVLGPRPRPSRHGRVLQGRGAQPHAQLLR